MTRFSIFCALLAMTVAPTRLTLVSAAPLCPLGDATLNGTYIVSGGGTVATVGPVTSVGEVTYDGKGNSDATYTVSLNGAMHTITVTGTYTRKRGLHCDRRRSAQSLQFCGQPQRKFGELDGNRFGHGPQRNLSSSPAPRLVRGCCSTAFRQQGWDTGHSAPGPKNASRS